MQRYRYYDLIMAAFVATLLCTNLIASAKVIVIFGIDISSSVLFFPITFFFNDILTEVYGYARSRRVIWAGFSALALAVAMSKIVISLPPANEWQFQDQYEAIFSQTPRIVMASFAAFFCGEFFNSYILAKMKILTKGKHLWSRTIGSTVIGQAVDTAIFYPVAFLGFWQNDLLLVVMFASYVGKVIWEIIATPLIYVLIGFLKKKENEDHYDYNTNFTPFALKD